MCNFIYIHFENIFLFLCFFSSFHCTFKHVIISKPLWTRGEVFGFVSSTLLVAKVSIKIAFHVCLFISRGIWPITTQVSFFGSKAFSALAKRSWWFENSLLKEISCPTNGLEFSVWFSNFLRTSKWSGELKRWIDVWTAKAVIKWMNAAKKQSQKSNVLWIRNERASSE